MINLKRTLGFALLIYVGTFITAFVAMMALGIDPATNPADMPLNFCIINIIGTAVIASLGFWLYSRKNAGTVTWKSGLLFGIIGVVLGFILDLILFSMMPGGNSEMLTTYYTDYRFWLILAAYPAATTITAALIAKKK